MLQLTTRLKTNIEQSRLNQCLNEVLKQQESGFIGLAHETDILKKSIQLGQEIKKSFSHLVLIGVGGSSMGPRALSEIAHATNVFFLDNVDSVETERVLKSIPDLEKTAWLFISKSGSTIEVLWTFDYIREWCERRQKSFWPQTFFIAEEKSNPLSDLAREKKRALLPIPESVGGRFSVLSPVGLVLTEYLGLSAEKLREGSRLALADQSKILQYTEQALASFQRGEELSIFWFYNSNSRWFGEWLKQLWAESLGKSHTRDNKKAPLSGTPIILIGSCDQHSILQQIIEGPQKKFVQIFRFKSIETSSQKIENPSFSETLKLKGLGFGDLIQSQAIATEENLFQSKISTLLVEVDGSSEKDLGYLFMFFQVVVAVMGEYHNINAYNQPAVASTKEIALQILMKRAAQIHRLN